MAGLTDYAEALALAYLLPGGTNKYVALFTTMPAEDGTGAVEATGGTYARIAHSTWINEVVDGVTYRKNNGTIEFAVLTANISGVVGWGIYDALTVGNLIAFGEILGPSGDAITRNYVIGDLIRFSDQDLKIGLGNED